MHELSPRSSSAPAANHRQEDAGLCASLLMGSTPLGIKLWSSFAVTFLGDIFCKGGRYVSRVGRNWGFFLLGSAYRVTMVGSLRCQSGLQCLFCLKFVVT